MSNSDYSGPKTWVASPGNYFPNRNGDAPSWVIIHGTAGGNNATGTANYLNSVSLSVHYIVGLDGSVVQMVHEADGAWGNGILEPGCDPWWNTGENPNNRTISIEHVKPATDNSSILTEAQKKASFTLVKDICERNNIPKRKADSTGGITGHYSLEPISRVNCPGPYPWSELFSFITGAPVSEYESNPHFKAEADRAWASIMGANAAPTGTGIFKSWVSAWEKGKFLGAPVTKEFSDVNSNGQSIIVQQFSGTRCEWVSGAAHWYSFSGEITF